MTHAPAKPKADPYPPLVDMNGHGHCPKPMCGRQIGTIGYVAGGTVGADGVRTGGRVICCACMRRLRDEKGAEK